MARLSKRSQEGYLLIDHRHSPGTQLIPSGMTYESATYTCTHCSRVVIMNPQRTRERHYCLKCDHYICDGCAATGECMPLAAVFDKLEASIIRAEQADKATIYTPTPATSTILLTDS